ncbi:hypothetical protein [Streptomyces sp. NPDC053079]|uniref:hypothetical protein n=1 Tax=Streptomyces sp. NPDC053079 TaxID=3365697 RepID=UPI0037CD61AA
MTGGKATVLATAGPLATAVKAHSKWKIRVLRKGATAQIKAWPSAGPEPAGFTAEFEDADPDFRIGQRAKDSTTAPAMPLLQPGDLVLFDVNDKEEWPVEPDEYAVDHVGIYLGLDKAGKRRFLSSRKSCDGPTMADVSGSSTLDSPGIYADSLHTVHRI